MYVITGWQVLSNLALLLVSVLCSRKAFREPFVLKKSNRCFAILSIFILYLYAFHDMDYLGYKSMVDSYSSHFEDVYLYILDYISDDYFLFRLIVFGSAFLLMLFSFKRMNVGFDLCFLFYVLTSVLVLSYSRFTLALSLSFLGYTMVVKPYRPRWLSFSMGVALIVSSVFFHRSSLIIIPLYIGSLIVHRFNRRNIILFAFLVIVVVALYLTMGAQLLSVVTQSDSLEEFEANRSLVAGSGGEGLGIFIHRLLQYSKFYLTLLLFVIVVAKHNFKDWPISMKMVSSFYVLTIIIAFLFSFNIENTNTGLLYYRTLYYSSLAMCIFLAYCYKNNIRRKFIKTILYIGLLSQLYGLAYHAYHAFLGLYIMYS